MIFLFLGVLLIIVNQLRKSFEKIKGEKFDFKLGEVSLYSEEGDSLRPCDF